MITIVEGPKANKRERKEFTCFNCGTVYQADKWDYEYWNPNCEWGYRIPCPVCGDKTWHKEITTRYGMEVIDNIIYKGYRGVRDLKPEEFKGVGEDND